MGCPSSCCADDPADELSARHKGGHTKVFKPTSSRGCTDLICLLIWLICMAAMIGCAGYAIATGNLNFIIYPTDYLGQFCGKSDGVVARPKIFYPRLDADIEKALPLLMTGVGIFAFKPFGLCVAECPKTFSLADPISYGGPTYPGVSNTSSATTYYNMQRTQRVVNFCLPTTDTLPSAQRTLCGVPNCTDAALNASLEGTLTCADIPATPNVRTAWEVTTDLGESLCKLKVVEQVSSVFLPPQRTSETGRWEEAFAKSVTGLHKFFHEVYDYRMQCGVMGFAAPFAVSFVWFICLFLFAGVLVVLALLILLIVLVASCLYLYAKAGMFDIDQIMSGLGNATNGALDAVDQSDKAAYITFSVLATLALVIFIIFLVLARHNVWRCIAIVRETTKVFYSIPLLAVYPLVPVAFNIALVFYGVTIAAYIWTQDESGWSEMNNLLGDVIKSNSTDPVDYLSGFNDLSTDTRKGIMFAVHFVGCLWTYYFINACAYTTYAGVGGRWFFSHENGELKVRFYGGCGSILDSAWCVFTRHLGTMAFGSAILTIIMLVRLVCEYINQKTKDIQETNLPLKFAMCCVRCCLKCLYETVKRVTEYGYIFTAVEGKNFCSSGWSTFDLIAANPGQVWVNNMVGSIIYLMIAISIPVVTALLGFLWCDRAGSTDPIWPAVFIGLTSLVISTGVSEVFRSQIDTIFLCAWKDMKVTNNQPYYMSESLRSSFGIEPAEIDPETVHINKVDPISSASRKQSAAPDELQAPPTGRCYSTGGTELAGGTVNPFVSK